MAKPVGGRWLRRHIRWIWQRSVQITSNQRFLLAEAVIWLILARLALLFLPFRVLAAWFGVARRPDENFATAPLAPVQAKLATEVGWAVTRAARHIPFRAVCLPQAIAAKAMLNRRNIPNVMHFGVTHQEQKLAAHAWLDAGGVEVTGFPVGPAFVEVTRFH